MGDLLQSWLDQLTGCSFPSDMQCLFFSNMSWVCCLHIALSPCAQDHKSSDLSCGPIAYLPQSHCLPNPWAFFTLAAESSVPSPIVCFFTLNRSREAVEMCSDFGAHSHEPETLPESSQHLPERHLDRLEFGEGWQLPHWELDTAELPGRTIRTRHVVSTACKKANYWKTTHGKCSFLYLATTLSRNCKEIAGTHITVMRAILVVW